MRRDERGIATVYAVVVVSTLTLVAVVLMQLSALVGLRQRASAAADLAALAASRASSEGRDGCLAARSIARDNDADVVACRMDLEVATVTVRAVSPRWWGGQWSARSIARAAPVTYLE